MRILFIGDVVGRSGREAILDHLPKAVADWTIDLAIVNGENAAGGFGITEAIYNDFIDAGADAVTLGNHSWNQKEALVFIERAPRLIRPINYMPGTPGRGAALIDTRKGQRALVINALGRLFMEPVDDPFALIDRELEACPPDQLKIGAFSAASNVTGIRSDLRAIARLLHAHGGWCVADFAAAAPYIPVRLAETAPGAGDRIDAALLSPHKYPGGPGASGRPWPRRRPDRCRRSRRCLGFHRPAPSATAHAAHPPRDHRRR